VAEPLTILIPARDEERRIGAAVAALRRAFPDAEIVVACDGSRDRTAAAARRAGARVVRLPRLGKGQALTLAERETPAGRLLLCDADLEGDLAPLLDGDADLAVAVFAERPSGGGFGIAKRVARALVRARSGFEAREPLSGQRILSSAAREACFPLTAGFGCEVRMTIDAVRAGLRVREVELPLRHRPTGRDAGGFLHRGRQLLDAVLATGPQAPNFRGLRLPLVGALVALGGLKATRRVGWSVAAIALLGLVDDLWSGPERGVRAHLRARRTGALKAVGIPALAFAATRSLRGALLVSLSANGLNLLDTRPGRALKIYLAGAVLMRGPARVYAPVAVLLAPYDLREMTMLGDAGSNALGAVLGYGSVSKLTARGQWLAIAALAGLTVVGETHSLGELIERSPGLSRFDRLGRPD
jgi:glucosyl-3-phosphoglycerate synthase